MRMLSHHGARCRGGDLCSTPIRLVMGRGEGGGNLMVSDRALYRAHQGRSLFAFLLSLDSLFLVSSKALRSRASGAGRRTLLRVNIEFAMAAVARL